ncbi:MAG: lipopolysaccharide heptosyltransferase II [Vampirovibrionales bacterium]
MTLLDFTSQRLPHSAQPQKEPVKSVLIVRLSAHGDVVQTLPTLGLIKQHWPSIRVGWLVESAAAPLLKGHPLIDSVHVVHRKQWLQTLTTSPWKAASVYQQVAQLRHELKEYTHSIDIQGLFKSAFWPWFAGIPHRYGYANAREQAFWLYNHRLPEFDRTQATVPAALEFAALAEEALGLDLLEYRRDSSKLPYPIPPVSVNNHPSVQALFHELDLSRPVVGIAPATQWPSKRWPNEYWLEVIQAVSQQANVVILGADSDRPSLSSLLEAINGSLHPRIKNGVGQTPLDALYTVASRLDVLVAPDSLWLHVGQAVSANPELANGKPYLVGVFGPTAPGRTGPLGLEHITICTQMPCQPCFKKQCPLGTTECLTSLSPQQVLEAIFQQLAKLPARAAL